MAKQFRPRGIEEDGLKYYQEQDKAGDYVSIDPSTNDYYLRNLGENSFSLNGNLQPEATLD